MSQNVQSANEEKLKLINQIINSLDDIKDELNNLKYGEIKIEVRDSKAYRILISQSLIIRDKK